MQNNPDCSSQHGGVPTVTRKQHGVALIQTLNSSHSQKVPITGREPLTLAVVLSRGVWPETNIYCVSSSHSGESGQKGTLTVAVVRVLQVKVGYVRHCQRVETKVRDLQHPATVH